MRHVILSHFMLHLKHKIDFPGLGFSFQFKDIAPTNAIYNSPTFTYREQRSKSFFVRDNRKKTQGNTWPSLFF